MAQNNIAIQNEERDIRLLYTSHLPQLNTNILLHSNISKIQESMNQTTITKESAEEMILRHNKIFHYNNLSNIQKALKEDYQTNAPAYITI